MVHLVAEVSRAWAINVVHFDANLVADNVANNVESLQYKYS
jgi:hypothetical protein